MIWRPGLVPQQFVKRYSPDALPLVTSRSADARPTRPAGIRLHLLRSSRRPTPGRRRSLAKFHPGRAPLTIGAVCRSERTRCWISRPWNSSGKMAGRVDRQQSGPLGRHGHGHGSAGGTPSRLAGQDRYQALDPEMRSRAPRHDHSHPTVRPAAQRLQLAVDVRPHDAGGLELLSREADP